MFKSKKIVLPYMMVKVKQMCVHIYLSFVKDFHLFLLINFI
jgi:hypothetical protein